MQSRQMLATFIGFGAIGMWWLPGAAALLITAGALISSKDLFLKPAKDEPVP